MNPAGSTITSQFRDALIDCKRLYIKAARECMEQQADADTQARHDFIRRMVDLHKGLLIKIYVTVARADSRWSRAEQQLARELIEHIWQQQLEGDALRKVAQRMFRDAGHLKWYSLIRPFDQVEALRDHVADVETVVMRIANLVAKADGSVASEEANAIRAIQHELQVHLDRLPLDDTTSHENAREQGAQAIKIVHQESSVLREEQQLSDSGSVAVGSEAERESLDQVLRRLEELIGLERVKKEIHTLTNFLNLQTRRQEAGLPRDELSLHMVFMGNPGTGKTTVARIVGQILNSLGLLKKGHLVETDRSGLVAEYAGQTGPKANRKIDEAIDGVLFIDEAYSLVSSAQEDAYGREAVQTIIKRMEDDRDRLVVILAGYPEPMEELLQSNPGMTSRFNTQFQFDDYAPVDLGRIYERMSEANQYVVLPATRAKLLLGFQWFYDHRDEHFGNGRLVRNVFENSIRQLANRVADVVPVTRELLTHILPEDIAFQDVPSAVWGPLKDGTCRFQVACEACGRSTLVKPKHLGQRVRCPHCQQAFCAGWGIPTTKPKRP